jgi:hypothetical protein
MAVINVSVPESGADRAQFVKEIIVAIQCGTTGAFADVLFDIKHRIELDGAYADGKVMIMTRTEDDPKIADKARLASVSWSGRMRDAAEEIYWATRSS